MVMMTIFQSAEKVFVKYSPLQQQNTLSSKAMI